MKQSSEDDEEISHSRCHFPKIAALVPSGCARRGWMYAIGDDKNYYLGLTYKDRTKKLAFHTVDLLTDLLDTGTLIIADSEVQVIADEESTKYFYYHLYKRPDGAQVLFLWNGVRNSTINFELKTPGSSAEHYSLTGESTPYPAFDGTTLKDIQLTSGEVKIFQINP